MVTKPKPFEKSARDKGDKGEEGSKREKAADKKQMRPGKKC